MTRSRFVATTGKLMCLLFATACASNGAPRTAENTRQVAFELLAPEARSVVLLGDFNHWAAPGVALIGPDSGGKWRLEMVVPGPRGRMNYVYLVDEQEYRTDNLRPIESDDYGGGNNILYIP